MLAHINCLYLYVYILHIYFVCMYRGPCHARLRGKYIRAHDQKSIIHKKKYSRTSKDFLGEYIRTLTSSVFTCMSIFNTYVLCVYIHTHTRVHICMHVCTLSLTQCIHRYIYAYIYVHIYIYIKVIVSTCIFAWTCDHMYTHIYIYA